jgi:hypothetical protein
MGTVVAARWRNVTNPAQVYTCPAPSSPIEVAVGGTFGMLSHHLLCCHYDASGRRQLDGTPAGSPVVAEQEGADARNGHGVEQGVAYIRHVLLVVMTFPVIGTLPLLVAAQGVE